MERRPRVVIIGGGFAGLNAAKALRRAPVSVLLIDRNNYHLFQPLLYQVASAGLSGDDIASPIRAVLRRQKNAEVLLGEVQSIDLDSRCIHMDFGQVDYDYLIVATGMETNYFGQDQWVEFAPGLKTMEDALECRRRILTAFEQAERESDPGEIRRLLTFVIVGAGPTGVELAGAIRDIAHEVMVKDFRHIDPNQARVVLVDAGPQVLAGYDDRLSARARRDIERMGVEVFVDSMVSDIDAEGVSIGEKRIDASTVIWAAGVRATPIGATMGVPLDRMGRVIVDETLRVPGRERVFVIGDLAYFEPEPGAGPLVGLAPVAIQQGRHTARNIVRHCNGEAYAPFRYRDKGQMATIGRARAVAQIWGMRFTGPFAWLLWLVVHLLFLIGFRNRLFVVLDWFYAYVGMRRSARLIIDVEHEPERPALTTKPPDLLPGPTSP
ncbi:MAG: NAD(P)/FAD-dependent oxidoreductase [Bradymonadaceae bacterium]